MLRLVTEQAAIPFDQLARFLDCGPDQAARIARHLTKAGLADYGRTLADEPHWLWLTNRGARLSGLDYQAEAPRVGAMARIRAVNEIRLHIAARAPEARWICSRSVNREQGRRGRRPNAIVEVDRERHAIVVRQGRRKDPVKEAGTLQTHMRRYDAVVCFADRRSLIRLRRLQAQHHWTKLVLRKIPAPPSADRFASPNVLSS